MCVERKKACGRPQETPGRPGPPPAAARCRWQSSPRTARSARSTRGWLRHPCASGYARIMPKLAANLSTLFVEVDFLERFAAAARAGFRAVEYQYPYEWRPEDIARAARDAGLAVVLHNMPAGHAARGERGTPRLPRPQRAISRDLGRAVHYSRAGRRARPHPNDR